MSTEKITCLLNWQATPYHVPVFLAQKLGFFANHGIKVAILEPSDPSDVTEIIGSGKSDLGLKAMIHTIAAKASGFNVTSIGTLLDEPLTGVVHVKTQSGITDFESLRGKKIGYVGHFGKVIIDELMRSRGFKETDYEAVRVGMNVTDAIKRGVIDAGVGLENVQQAELENWVESKGQPRSDVEMLRIDELADLGCCCFCSVLYIGNDEFIEKNPEKVKAFMAAIRESTSYMLANPDKAYSLFTEMKPALAGKDHRTIYDRSMIYFSKDQSNVQRDWNKVTGYSKRLGLVNDTFVQNMTNEFIQLDTVDR
ncbi:glycylpeptide N-tetradecanoyltransferase [Terramyces sp. JEL0728]|nr:glycylpeptide N-tetradecanoyltransferase [Terramyces sp. JEL0728]KAJ3268594.1 glycylpeptide N-tetradecanoyltransferase [Terramyces sp. JEL0728]